MDGGAEAEGAGLSTGEVALRFGVAPTTLRSWDRRYGIGPSEHRPGRHRRWSPEDVAVLERMRRLTSRGVPPAEAARAARRAPADGPGPGSRARDADAAPERGAAVGAEGSRAECRGLIRAALRLDAPAVQGALDAAVAGHGLVGAWEAVMAPTLRAVGRQWAKAGAGERYVEVEHLLSWHISTALRTAAAGASPPPREGGPVLLACAPDELHTLPLEAAAAGLALRGLPIRVLGAAVPAAALLEAGRRLGPAAVLLWSQGRSTADRELVRRLRSLAWGMRGARRRPLVLAAGPGWTGLPLPAGAVRPTRLGAALDRLSAARAQPPPSGEVRPRGPRTGWAPPARGATPP